jgi:RNA polymerase sigma-70 factor (ECF subfamily)
MASDVLTDDDLRWLVERARARDADAWEALYRRAYPRLFAYARRRCPHGHAADDAVSDTMTRALVRIDSFAWRGGGFDAWLYGILRNVLLERARAGARFVGDGPPDVPAHEPEPLGCVLAREEAVEVRRAFARLGPDEQELLELRVVGGLGADEVGRVIGKTAGAVRMAQTRALARLRHLIDDRKPA